MKCIIKFRIFFEDDDSIYRDIAIQHSQTFFELHEAILKMKLGGKATVIIPSALAFGASVNGPVKEYSAILYKLELGSSIHAEHIDVFHKSSYDGLWNFWKNQAADMEDWGPIFDYDPFFGRLPPGWEGK